MAMRLSPWKPGGRPLPSKVIAGAIAPGKPEGVGPRLPAPRPDRSGPRLAPSRGGPRRQARAGARRRRRPGHVFSAVHAQKPRPDVDRAGPAGHRRVSPGGRERWCQRRAWRLFTWDFKPTLSSSRLRRFGGLENSASCRSAEVNRPTRRTTILSPSSCHSSVEPGPTPSFRRTAAGTEI